MVSIQISWYQNSLRLARRGLSGGDGAISSFKVLVALDIEIGYLSFNNSILVILKPYVHDWSPNLFWAYQTTISSNYHIYVSSSSRWKPLPIPTPLFYDQFLNWPEFKLHAVTPAIDGTYFKSCRTWWVVFVCKQEGRPGAMMLWDCSLGLRCFFIEKVLSSNKKLPRVWVSPKWR